jgi:prepilin-type N-terminal cleavage/methylation domain-containing protein
MFKKAFTLLELVMVIVILGIVSSIGADIIANLYENYIKTRAINTLQSQTELVLDQIAKRLTYRIKPSVIARDSTGSIFPVYTFLSSADKDYDTLEWIGKDNESFRGIKNPGWSGFVDIESNETNKSLGTDTEVFGWIKTSGSELNTTSVIINALSYGQVDLNASASSDKPAIIFKGQASFDLSQYGWDGSEGNYTHKVQIPMGRRDILEFVDVNDTPGTIYEQYDLAWSAYAIVPEGSANDFNLTLKYNYQPWYGEKYIDENTSSAVLIEHASTFRFTQIGETIRIKLCINDANQSGDYNFAFCKERVVF